MNNDGITELNTYSLASEKQEKSTLEKILDRLDSLENNLKGKGNEWNIKPANATNAARKAAKSSVNGDVQSDDEQ